MNARARRRHTLRLPIIILSIGTLAGIALFIFTAAMEGIG